MYDKNNVFAKILRGEIPMNKKIYENEYAVSFHDVAPRAAVHALVIPRGEYRNILEFSERASATEQAGFWTAVRETVGALGLGDGVRVTFNAGPSDIQMVQHLHAHIIYDEKLKERLL